MDQVLLQLMLYGPLIALFGAAAVLAFIGSAVGVTRPSWLVLGYIAIILCFSQSTYGTLEATRTIYTRGSGHLFFPFIVWALWGMALVAPIWLAFGDRARLPCNLWSSFACFLGLFLAQFVVGLFFEVPVVKLLSSAGLINLLHLGIFVFLVLRVLGSRQELTLLETVIVFACVGRAAFGLVRWAAFGGDPANVYENVERIDVKLTFFEISDSAIAGVGMFYCLRRLIGGWGQIDFRERTILAIFVLLEMATILLSYRRTAWGGLVLVILFLIALLPSRSRMWALLLSPVLAVPILWVANQRLSIAAKGRGLFERFYYDVLSGGIYAGESARSLELKFTLATILENPILGVGMWGTYRGASSIAWQGGEGAVGFVHSGLLHVLLKTGFVGLALCLFAAVQFVRYAKSVRAQLLERDRWLFDAAIAGLIFLIPDFLFGTPLTQFRETQLIGLLVAIPYLIGGVALRANAVKR